jgi:hypothetical protein
MAAPVISFLDENDVELNDLNPNNLGIINAGSVSDEKIIKIVNNKDGEEPVSKMESITITTVTKNGLNSGDGVANGQEAVEGKWMNIKSVSDGDSAYTAVGGATVKSISNIRGDLLVSPGAPTGTPGEDTENGAIAAGTYYYVISALDDSGETLPGTESAAIIVEAPNNKIDLSWDAVENAASYSIYRTTTQGVYGETSFIANVTTTTYTDVLANPVTGQPKETATVTYQHAHIIKERLDVPTTATGGAVQMGLQIAYSYV